MPPDGSRFRFPTTEPRPVVLVPEPPSLDHIEMPWQHIGEDSGIADVAAAPLTALQRAAGARMANQLTESTRATPDRAVGSSIAVQGASTTLAAVDRAAGVATNPGAATPLARLYRAGSARFAAAHASGIAVGIADCRIPAIRAATPRRALVPAGRQSALLLAPALALLVAIGALETPLDAAAVTDRAATRAETGHLAAALTATLAACTLIA